MRKSEDVYVLNQDESHEKMGGLILCFTKSLPQPSQTSCLMLKNLFVQSRKDTFSPAGELGTYERDKEKEKLRYPRIGSCVSKGC